MGNNTKNFDKVQAVKEMVLMLYESTRELSQKEDKTLEDHEQIRKNCETALACFANMWI